MRRTGSEVILAVMMLAACSRPQSQSQSSQAANRAAPATKPVTSNAVEPAQPTRTVAPPAQTPVIDPKSSEAAELIARGFVDLINRRRFDEAYMLLGPGAPPRAVFDQQFASWSDLHASMGTPGPQEGAAGSIYLSIPVQLTGRLHGERSDRSLSLVLRRVNDVPGSTDAQRHWHIERIDAQAG